MWRSTFSGRRHVNGTGCFSCRAGLFDRRGPHNSSRLRRRPVFLWYRRKGWGGRRSLCGMRCIPAVPRRIIHRCRTRERHLSCGTRAHSSRIFHIRYVGPGSSPRFLLCRVLAAVRGPCTSGGWMPFVGGRRHFIIGRTAYRAGLCQCLLLVDGNGVPPRFLPGAFLCCRCGTVGSGLCGFAGGELLRSSGACLLLRRGHGGSRCVGFRCRG